MGIKLESNGKQGNKNVAVSWFPYTMQSAFLIILRIDNGRVIGKLIENATVILADLASSPVFLSLLPPVSLEQCSDPQFLLSAEVAAAVVG